MSKAEIVQQLETLSPQELDEVAQRIDELRFRDDFEELSAEHRIILEERMADYRSDPTQGEDLHVVANRILRDLKK
jgi:hypothetical protein